MFSEQLDKLLKPEYFTEKVETLDVHPNQSEDEDSDPDIRKLEGNAQKLRPCLKLKNSLTML